MVKKIISFFAVIVILSMNFSNVFAATTSTKDNSNASNQIESSKSTMEVVDKSKLEMNLGDMGNFTKELTSYDLEKKELNITLTVKNTANEEQILKPVEIFLVLDNSKSMTNTYEGKVKTNYVAEAATKFTNLVFDNFKDAKVGVIGFSSLDPLVNNNSIGTINDATLLQGLSAEKTSVLNAISTYNSKTGPYTNIEAGLALAEKSFTNSTSSEKYVILISDYAPNLSLDTEHTLTYSGTNSLNTKNRLQALEQKGFNPITILMGYADVDNENPSAPLISDGSRHMTYGELANEILGTTENPTAGDFYFIDYENLFDTVTEKIFNSIASLKENTLKNVVIKDYFPQEIIDNFTFSYIETPNIGTASDKIDLSTDSITWTIKELKAGETAKLVYKLKLNDKFNKEILDKNIPTNKEVDISYETPNGNGTDSSTESPKVKLHYEEPTVTPPQKEEPVEPKEPEKLPQTGISDNIIFVGITISILFAISRFYLIKKTK